jgi:hypothetical protein
MNFYQKPRGISRFYLEYLGNKTRGLGPFVIKTFLSHRGVKARGFPPGLKLSSLEETTTAMGTVGIHGMGGKAGRMVEGEGGRGGSKCIQYRI